MIGSVLGGRYELLQEGDEGPVFETYKALDRVARALISRRRGFLISCFKLCVWRCLTFRQCS